MGNRSFFARIAIAALQTGSWLVGPFVLIAVLSATPFGCTAHAQDVAHPDATQRGPSPALQSPAALGTGQSAAAGVPAPPVGRDRGDDGGRVMAELMLGVVGYAVGGLAGAATGCGIGALGGGELGCMFGIVGGGVIGAGFGIALGIDAVGDSMGANGSFWATYLGQAIGGTLSLAFIPALENPWGPSALLTAMTVLPLTGGLIGYELSNDAPADDSGTPAWRAAVVPTRRGATARWATAF